MAQPPRYQRQKDFTVDYGSETDHGAINAELDDAATSINGIRTNLALIQRDDGKLVQGVVDADSVDPDFADELSGQVASGVAGALAEAEQSAVAATLAANAADTSKAAAANSATSSATSASAAASSASSAAASSGIATAKANDATTSANNAAGGATSAAVAATNADIAANDAAASSVAAAASADTATTKATDAATSATNAASSATNAAASAAAAAATYDAFDDRFLGAKAGDPATDNDGNALATGALYWNTTAGEMRIYTGSAWITAISGIPNDGAVTTAKLADGVLTANAAGRAKMADAFITQAKLADGILTADAAGRAKMADAFITQAKLVDGILTADTAGRVKMADSFISQAKLAVNVAGLGPAFTAFTLAAQALSSGVNAKVNFTNETQDTNSNFFDSRFTPTVAGYYVLCFNLYVSATSLTSAFGQIYINGAGTFRGTHYSASTGLNAFGLTTSAVQFFNGSTDFAEVYVSVSGGSPKVEFGNFSGGLLRGI